MPAKLNITTVRQRLLEEGYTLLDSNYINSHHNLRTICSNGHEFSVCMSKWMKGTRCYQCYQRKIDREVIQDTLSLEKYRLVSESSAILNTVIIVECPNGHQYETTFYRWEAGTRCRECGGTRQLWTRDSIQKEVNKYNYQLLILNEEINSKNSRINIICKEGHLRDLSWRGWLNNPICPECRKLHNIPKIYIERKHKKNTKYTYEEIKKEVESDGYQLVSTSYLNCKEKLHTICPSGHDYYVPWDWWKNLGRRCPKCGPKKVLDRDTIGSNLKDNGFELVAMVYNETKPAQSNLRIRCPNGHVVEVSCFNLRNSKFRCKACVHEDRLIDVDYIENYVESFGYKLIGDYVRSDEKMHLLCPSGHDYFSTWDNFRYNGRRCTKCGVGTSKIEKRFLEDLENIISPVDFHNRTLIKPKELDFVLHSHNLAIELNGLVWHSEIYGRKKRNYHRKKLEECNQSGYRLISIFEDEYRDKKEIVLNQIKNILGLSNSTKIYARNCEIKEINYLQTSSFLANYHIQGGRKGYEISLGAFHNGELISVMTFSNKDISNQFYAEEGTWELARFCSNYNYSIEGIASKLLKHFERNYVWTKVFSFADRRWSEGNLYYTLGFELSSISPPSYCYFIPNKDVCKREHRYKHRKNTNDDQALSEWQNRQAQGYDRVWDCGYIKFIKYNNKDMEKN